jgi:pentatricopeptide repeat protein
MNRNQSNEQNKKNQGGKRKQQQGSKRASSNANQPQSSQRQTEKNNPPNQSQNKYQPYTHKNNQRNNSYSSSKKYNSNQHHNIPLPYNIQIQINRFPNTKNYTKGISFYGKNGNWRKALTLLQEMQDNNIAPDTITYSAAISACEKGGQWQLALTLLQEMELSFLLPNDISLQSIIDFHGFILPVCKVYLMKYIEKKVIRQVIVGKGIHSTDGPILKEGILEFLRQNYSDTVYTEEDTKNSGCLNIRYIPK